MLNVHGERDDLLGTGDRVGKRARVIGSTAETARKRPERPWTAARTMEVLRRCPLAIAQRLVHCAIALSTAVLDRVTKTMSTAVDEQLAQSPTCSPAPPPLLMISSRAKVRVQLHLPPLRSLDLLISPGTLVCLRLPLTVVYIYSL